MPAPRCAPTMPLSTTLLRRAALILALLINAPAQAAGPQVHLEGQAFDSHIQLAGAPLLLNGVGLRAVAWIKGYAAALYLSAKASEAAQVLATPGPKRLQLRMLREVAAVEFVKAFERGMKRNASNDEQSRLAERMGRFERFVSSTGVVRQGDVIDLDFVPGRGTSLTINGRGIGTPIAGDEFYALLLKMFIGDKVSDAGLRAGLLGGRT